MIEIGTRFGRRVVLSKAKRKGCWVCRCDCGHEAPVAGSKLLKGGYQQCWKCARNHIDLTGKRFNKWTVIGRERENQKGTRIWHCVCDCGTKQVLATSQLKQGRSKSCKKCYERPDVRLRPYEALYNKFASEAKRRKEHGSEFTYLDFVAFTTQPDCHYCKAAVFWTEFNLHGAGKQAYNLDRKNNLMGYTKDNTVVCCERCNRAKGSKFTYGEWYGMTAYFRRKNKKDIEDRQETA